MVEILDISSNSPAEHAGLLSGDLLVQANGHVIRDALDIEFYIEGEDRVEILYIRDGEERRTVLLNCAYDDSGIETEYLELRRCRNKCVFCFIDQQPKGLRDTLYVKDEDIRYSFLHSNYITASNTPDWEWKRVIEQKMAPLYFSVHATDEEIRAKMLGILNPPPIMPILSRLTRAGIQIHCQIVLVPGFNDGAVLRKTLVDLHSLGKNSLTCAVVPVGLTKYRDCLPEIPAVSHCDAVDALRIIDELRAVNVRPEFFQAADELFLLAEKDIPEDEYYGEYDQLDNGVGMARLFIDDAMSCAREPKVRLQKPRPLSVEIVTGTRAAKIFDAVLPSDLGIEGVQAKITPVVNDFWGEMVTAGNLLTGRDILRAIQNSKADIIFIPPKVINDNGLFLDDMAIEELDNSISGEIAVGADYLSDMQELIIDYSSSLSE